MSAELTTAEDAAAAGPGQADANEAVPTEDGSGGRQSTGATRRPARRRGRRGRVVVGAAGVASLLWLAYASPVTLVEHVVVDAPRGMSEEAIRLASGISAADHVPAVDAERVRTAIMTELPAVADVQVTRSLPSTVRLTVAARTGVAAVAAGKGYYVIDGQGVVFDKVRSAKKLPVIKAGSDTGRQTALAVLLSLPEDLRGEVRRVSAKTRDDVALVLRDGAKVRWGGVADADLKARVLAGLVAVKARTYDVRVPLLPTTSGTAAPDGAEAG